MPSPRQRQFWQAKARYVAYGGARGGGKSWAVRHKAMLLCLRYPGIRVLLVRRSYPELRENHILPLRAMLAGVARYRDGEKAFDFPNGARLRFGYCDGEADVLRYQGQEYDAIFLDEATQLTERQFWALSACLRGTGKHPRRMYLTCNPGGIGHGWVKRLFVDRAYLPGEDPADYEFIPARVWDNKALLERDPDYVRGLERLPEEMRRAWLEGDWDVFAGQYFTEFRRELHVAEPFSLPPEWRRYAALDYGLDMLACYWIALEPEGKAWVYRELYEPGLIISQAARRIRELSAEPLHAALAPPDLWGRRQQTGQSAAELFAQGGVPLTRADNRRVQGWYALREWLSPDDRGEPRLRIFKNCRNLIRCLPQLCHDDKNPEDVAADPHELTHGPDALRYFVAGRPAPGRVAPRAQWQWGAAATRADPAGRGDRVRVI